MPASSLIVTTTNEVTGARITAYLGVVRGLVVRTPNIGASILGGLKSLMGGNISQYSTVCEAARQQAFDLMVEHAKQAGRQGIRYFDPLVEAQVKQRSQMETELHAALSGNQLRLYYL